MTGDGHRFAALWPLVRPHLPHQPGRVVEIGCGPAGGFVPALLGAGHDAIGVDPEAPAGGPYRRIPFESFEPEGTFDAVVASASLHHVDDLGRVLDRVREVTGPGAPIVVLEWAWERFDEVSARWCFDRLAPDGDEPEPTWLQAHRERWRSSGLSWDAYLAQWATGERLHTGRQMLAALDRRFTRVDLCPVPYFFHDLAGMTFDDEQAAIDAGTVAGSAFRYVGVRP